MTVYSSSNTAEQNLALLAENPYPGRLLVVGFPDIGGVALAYALMGRSRGSRNRRLVVADNVVSTEIVDPSLPVGDPDLTIYDAMRRVTKPDDGGDIEIVSNGNQTDRVARYLRCGEMFEDAMSATEHEPDPLHTPRITGYHDMDDKSGQRRFGLAVVSKNPNGEGSARRLYTERSPEIVLGQRGVGYCVHTYEGDGDSLRSFDDPPFAIPMQGGAEDIAGMLWSNLDSDNRVAVAVKTISPAGEVNFAVINEYA